VYYLRICKFKQELWTPLLGPPLVTDSQSSTKMLKLFKLHNCPQHW